MKNINILYHKESRNDEGRIQDYRKVTVEINRKSELILSCCDINETAENHYGDRGVEFYMVLNKLNTQKFASEMGLHKVDYSEKELLEKIHDNYGNIESCFLDMKSFFTDNDIAYQFSRW